MPFAAQHIRDARNALRKRDPVMREIIRQIGPFTAKTHRDRFVALARAIVYQQISGKAAASIWKQLQQLVEPEGVNAESIDRKTLDQLRTAGISRQKGTYLKDLAAKVLAGDVVLNQLGRKSDEDVIAELTRVKGIGRWTAQIFLMFTLTRKDILPVDDLGIKNAMVKAYGLKQIPDSAKMESLAEPWRPYATFACWYLWQFIDAEE